MKGAHMNNTSTAFNILNSHKKEITQQQYMTIKGQIKAGNAEGAIKGLNRLLRKKVSA